MTAPAEDRPPLARLRASGAFHTVLLGLFAMAAAALLATGNLGTEDAIRQRLLEDLKASIGQVVPGKLHDNDLLADTLRVPVAGGGEVLVYRARLGGRVEGVAYRVTGAGYAGPVSLILGVRRDGALLGVRVLSHTETPGLGDKIEAGKSPWIRAFDGRSLEDPEPARWKVRKDGGAFDQFSGATVTPRAVVKAVKEGLEFFAAHRDLLLDEGADAAGGGAAKKGAAGQ